MSKSVRPQRWQPIRLPRPRDSQGKNTGVGCHFLLQSMKVKRESEVAQSSPILCNPTDCSLPDSSVDGDSPGKNTGVGCHVLLQRISPTQGLNPGLLRCWRILYRLSHQGSSCSPIPGGLFLPLVEKHQTMNVLWECIFFINRSIITVDAVYKITCQGHFISPL